MYLPDKNAARQLLDGLDSERKEFAIALSKRFGALSAVQLLDEKVVRQTFMLELQARCSPDLAARIAYTSEDMLIPLAIALVHARSEEYTKQVLYSKYKTAAIVVPVVIATVFFVRFIYVSFIDTTNVSVPTSTSAPAGTSGR
jgi:hypothetical protein